MLDCILIEANRSQGIVGEKKKASVMVVKL